MSKYKVGEIVWGKVSGYPWWPAVIAQIDSDQKFFVNFIGSNSHAKLGLEKIKKYEENYEKHTEKAKMNLYSSIKTANKLIKKESLKESNVIEEIDKNSSAKGSEDNVWDKNDRFLVSNPKMKRKRPMELYEYSETNEFVKQLEEHFTKFIQTKEEIKDLIAKKLVEDLQDERIGKMQLNIMMKTELGLLLQKIYEYTKGKTRLKEVEVASKNAMQMVKNIAYKEIFEYDVNIKKKVIEDEEKLYLEKIIRSNSNFGRNINELARVNSKIKMKQLDRHARTSIKGWKNEEKVKKSKEQPRKIELRTRDVIVRKDGIKKVKKDLEGMRLRDGKVLKSDKIIKVTGKKANESLEYKRKLRKDIKSIEEVKDAISENVSEDEINRKPIKKKTTKPKVFNMTLRSYKIQLRPRSTPLIHHKETKNQAKVRKKIRYNTVSVMELRNRKITKQELKTKKVSKISKEDSKVDKESSSEELIEESDSEESDSEESVESEQSEIKELSESESKASDNKESEEMSEDEKTLKDEEEKKFKKKSGKPFRQIMRRNKDVVMVVPLAMALRSRKEIEEPKRSVELHTSPGMSLRNRKITHDIIKKEQKVHRKQRKKIKPLKIRRSLSIEDEIESVKEKTKGMKLRNQKIIQKEKAKKALSKHEPMEDIPQKSIRVNEELRVRPGRRIKEDIMSLRNRPIRKTVSDKTKKKSNKPNNIRIKPNKTVEVRRKSETKHSKPQKSIKIKKRVNSNIGDMRKKLRSAKKLRDTKKEDVIKKVRRRVKSEEKSKIEMDDKFNYIKKRKNTKSEDERIIVDKNNKQPESMIVEEVKRRGKNKKHELAEANNQRESMIIKKDDVRTKRNVKTRQQGNKEGLRNKQRKKRGASRERGPSAMVCEGNSDTEAKESQKKNESEIPPPDPDLARDIIEKIAEELQKVLWWLLNP